MKTPRSMKAWLVTWEWSGEHAKHPNKIAAVLNSRLSQGKVQDIVEFIYLQEGYSISEKMACAHHRTQNPYPAKINIVRKKWPVITCGHHPFIQAQLVNELTVLRDSNGFDSAINWTNCANGKQHHLVLRPLEIPQ